VRVLVLGGSGFLGRHVVGALLARGHRVVIGSRQRTAGSPRRLARAPACEWRVVRFEHMAEPQQWDAAVQGVDVVVNCVGILREWRRATYECVHRDAPAALARACARAGTRRLVHVSALGLHESARSRFILSKIGGERAIRGGGSTYTIVRPSLLDGPGGYGARWIRALARLPIHAVPADAAGRIAVLDVRDAGEAIAALCEDATGSGSRDVEIGGTVARTLHEHLAALRRMHSDVPAWCLRIPPAPARFLSHACDLFHISPFSFGHLELLRLDNKPAANLLPALLGRAPQSIGGEAADHGLASGIPSADRI